MEPALRLRIEKVLGRPLVAWQSIRRGYTPAARFRLEFADGSTAFAKVATTPETATELRREHARYVQVRNSEMALVYGFEDDAHHPLLLLEDLSAAEWPPPWPDARVADVLHALDRIASVRPLPPELPALESRRSALSGWPSVAREPGPFLALGMCSQAWLEQALPQLLAAEEQAELAGDDLLHLDVRSDNLCFVGDRVVFVDWNLAMRGNRKLDRAFWAPSLRLEGGPLPEAVIPNEPALSSLVAGFFAARAGLPPIPHAPSVRWIQLRQLRIALPWAVRSLGLPALDKSWAAAEVARVDAALHSETLDDNAWHHAMEEIIGDAYLAASGPRAQSGKSGDETDWRWSRELVLDALPRPGAVLDVGCANGYLCESLERWAAERGSPVRVFGLEISPRLAELAKRRFARRPDAIAIGNVIDWVPPHRFDLVHLGLDYVPASRRRELLVRVLRDLLTPGGRVVLRPERVVAGAPDLRDEVAALGFEIGGQLECAHPHSGALRRTVWLEAPR